MYRTSWYNCMKDWASSPSIGIYEISHPPRTVNHALAPPSGNWGDLTWASWECVSSSSLTVLWSWKAMIFRDKRTQGYHTVGILMLSCYCEYLTRGDDLNLTFMEAPSTCAPQIFVRQTFSYPVIPPSEDLPVDWKNKSHRQQETISSFMSMDLFFYNGKITPLLSIMPKTKQSHIDRYSQKPCPTVPA